MSSIYLLSGLASLLSVQVLRGETGWQTYPNLHISPECSDAELADVDLGKQSTAYDCLIAASAGKTVNYVIWRGDLDNSCYACNLEKRAAHMYTVLNGATSFTYTEVLPAPGEDPIVTNAPEGENGPISDDTDASSSTGWETYTNVGFEFECHSYDFGTQYTADDCLIAATDYQAKQGKTLYSRTSINVLVHDTSSNTCQGCYRSTVSEDQYVESLGVTTFAYLGEEKTQKEKQMNGILGIEWNELTQNTYVLSSLLIVICVLVVFGLKKMTNYCTLLTIARKGEYNQLNAHNDYNYQSIIL